MQVDLWLRQRGLEQHAALFAEQEIGLDILGTLTDDDMREMGLPLGARKRLLAAIAKDLPPINGAAQNPSETGDGERRQVTVLFCDLVEFTRLSTAMDPEDLEALIGRFIRVCRHRVARWGGHVGNYLGDGVLVYFGWPRAFEDAPQRAAHASLDIVRAVADLTGPGGAPLAVRVGMATGMVLIGRKMDAGSGAFEAVFGKTPNIAARLETLAEPGEVLLDATTAALLSDSRFAVSNLGSRPVKGFTRPVEVWRLDGSETRARSHPTRASRIAEKSIEGREGPLNQLFQWWHDVVEGKGLRLVSLTGEAGIGKSHLCAHFLRHCRNNGGQGYELNCWPYNENATLYPVIAWLNDRAAVKYGDTAKVREQAFVAMAELDGVDPASFLRGLGDLLELDPAEGKYTATSRRAAWFAAIAEVLRALAARAPVLWLIEDMHWSDPLTAQLCDYIAEQCADCALMILATSRPHYVPHWSNRSVGRKLPLSRVGRAATMRIVDQLADGKSIDPSIRARIIDASDGVPLFINELTREVIDRSGNPCVNGSAITIPATLQGVLTARLDSSFSAKPVAQVASCLGREFQPHILAQVMHIAPTELQRKLDALEALALIERQQERETTYIFGHALIQEAAYQSQPKARRRDIHSDIADVLAGDDGADARQLANHLTAAERYEEAVARWKQAGDRAVRRSAQSEAIEHYHRGLALLDRLPDDAVRDRARLALLLALGPVLSSHDGYGADRVGALYAQTADIADRVGTNADRFTVRRGLWLFRLMAAQYRGAEEVALEMLDLASQTPADAASMLEANRALGATAFMLGKLSLARRHLEAGLPGYASGVGARNSEVYGDDPGLACMGYLASTLWFLGHPDRARDCCSKMLDIARTIDHPFSMARSLTFASFTYLLMRDIDLLLPAARQATEYADKYEYPFHQGVGRIFWGWGLCQVGEHDRGWALMEDGYAQYSRSGSQMLQPLYLSLMAGVARDRGQHDAAMEFSQQAMTSAARSQEGIALSDVLRLHGELTADAGDRVGGLALIERAAGVAIEQSARFCLLRARVAAARIDPERAEILRSTLATFDPAMRNADIDAARRTPGN